MNDTQLKLQRIRDFVTARNPDLLGRIRRICKAALVEDDQLATEILDIIEDEIEFHCSSQLGQPCRSPLK